jgi:hypothetical protein
VSAETEVDTDADPDPAPDEAGSATVSAPPRLCAELDRLRLPLLPAAFCARAATAAATVTDADHGHDCNACDRNLGGA